MNSTKDLVLASSSPRRKQLLEQAGFRFSVRTKEVEEIFPPDIPAEAAAQYLAELKNRENRKIASRHEIVLTADTTVVVDDLVLGKPANKEEAQGMLLKLAGRSHFVYSGVCITTDERKISFTVETEVIMTELSMAEINHYIETCRPFDKAGAYGIQEWIGLVGIDYMKGSYSNVVGLPVKEVYMSLKNEFGLSPI